MPKDPKDLRRDIRIREHREKSFARAINLWMLRRARKESAEAVRELQGKGRVSKAAGDDEELKAILMRFGVAFAEDSAISVSATTQGLDTIVDPKLVAREMQQKEFKLKLFQQLDGWYSKRAEQISADTKKMVRDSIQRLITQSLLETPRPSMGEIARRIRTQTHGEDVEGRIYAFSPERAAVIARTELVQAENTGKFEAYKVAGVKKKRWLAKRDGKSGDRHHERMHGVTIDIDEKFTTPLGNDLRFPGDPRAPIGDTVNCRCSLRAVVVEE